MGYRLIVRDGGKKRTYPLTGEVVSVGRSTDNTIPIKENGSSRHHCQVSQQGEAFFVQDLGSLNGTRVAGRRTRGRVPIQDGDLVEFGDACFRFRVIG